jgi:hypothetical protein
MDGTSWSPLRPPLADIASGKTCRWPMWGLHEKPTGIFCEAPRASGTRLPYCAEHCQRARLDLSANKDVTAG